MVFTLTNRMDQLNTNINTLSGWFLHLSTCLHATEISGNDHIVNHLFAFQSHQPSYHTGKLFDHVPGYFFLMYFWLCLHSYNTRTLGFHSKRCVFLMYRYMHKNFKYVDASE